MEMDRYQIITNGNPATCEISFSAESTQAFIEIIKYKTKPHAKTGVPCLINNNGKLEKERIFGTCENIEWLKDEPQRNEIGNERIVLNNGNAISKVRS